MELKSVETVINILYKENEEDMDQLQRDASISTSRYSTKADLNYSNGKTSTNEGLIVGVNMRRKNCANNDAVEPQQIPHNYKLVCGAQREKKRQYSTKAFRKKKQ
jgi:hypothetical protein